MQHRHVLSIMKDTLSALLFLHDQHLVHRDIKGENIFLENTGAARLGDLNGVRHTVYTFRGLRHCGRSYFGTVGFAAPEVVAMVGQTTASDVW